MGVKLWLQFVYSVVYLYGTLSVTSPTLFRKQFLFGTDEILHAEK